jgi:hypothetical protein
MCTEFGHRLPVNDDREESNKDMSDTLATAVDAIEAALDDSSQVYVYLTLEGAGRQPLWWHTW